MITVFEGVVNPKGPHCDSNSKQWPWCLAEHIVRTMDFMTWEESSRVVHFKSLWVSPGGWFGQSFSFGIYGVHMGRERGVYGGTENQNLI